MDEAVMQMVLNQLGSAGGETPPETTTDPLMSALLGSLAQRQSERESEDDDELRRELARARRTIARLNASIRAADTMALYISELFGCCSTCWGLNRVCPTCRGAGGPGYREADAERLLEWVQPALARHGLQVLTTEAPPSSGHSETGGGDR
jgi:hypothetical protein